MSRYLEYLRFIHDAEIRPAGHDTQVIRFWTSVPKTGNTSDGFNLKSSESRKAFSIYLFKVYYTVIELIQVQLNPCKFVGIKVWE